MSVPGIGSFDIPLRLPSRSRFRMGFIRVLVPKESPLKPMGLPGTLRSDYLLDLGENVKVFIQAKEMETLMES